MCKKNARGSRVGFAAQSPSTPNSMLKFENGKGRVRNSRAFFLQHGVHSTWRINIDVGVGGAGLVGVRCSLAAGVFLHDPVPFFDLVLGLASSGGGGGGGREEGADSSFF